MKTCKISRSNLGLNNVSSHIASLCRQVLTGHGCFGESQNKIGREEMAQCRYFAADSDSAQHTLEDCPTSESEREFLVDQMGRDQCPPIIFAAMLAGGEGWGTVGSFCEAVMLQIIFGPLNGIERWPIC